MKGTGLGLFIVRAIARKHGGRVFAESEGEGHGATIVLNSSKLSITRSVGMSRVLIVEDEAHLAKGLQFNLEAEGHSVTVVGDGERALDLLWAVGRAHEFDAVVLDVMLPGKDGFTVAAELRAAKQLCARPHAHRARTARGRAQRICLRRRRLSSQAF